MWSNDFAHIVEVYELALNRVFVFIPYALYYGERNGLYEAFDLTKDEPGSIAPVIVNARYQAAYWCG
jgi:hypothetical protein